MSDGSIPEVGQLVMVRRRPALIRETKQFVDSFTKITQNLLEIEYIDGWDFPFDDTLIWEKEIDAKVISHLSIPDVGSPGSMPDNPDRFQAFLDAVTWSTQGQITQLIGLPDIHDIINITSPWNSAVQIEDFQLYPVMKALSMPRISMLLADDVGVGKTIEAGLIASELISQRGIRRILIICPASIQEQWQEEMRDKFNLDFIILDSNEGFNIQKTLGMDANPWTTSPRIITSMDYLRQQYILDNFEKGSSRLQPESAAVLPWDLLILDEAHNCTPSYYGEDSQRCQMLREITKYFEHRLFLTATPHNGFTSSFTGLLEILDPLRFKRKSRLNGKDRIQIRTVVVRRLKSEIDKNRPIPRFVKRTVEGIQVDLSAREKELFEALRNYRKEGIKILRRGGEKEQNLGYFIFSILTKRLLSSSYSFARSWWNHLSGYELEGFGIEEAEHSRKRAEMDIPEDEEKERRNNDAVRHGAGWLRQYSEELQPFIEDISSLLEDMGWHEEITDQGIGDKTQFPADRKFEALTAWIEENLIQDGEFRSNERLIIFTEYKDTQDYLLSRFQKEKGWTNPTVQILYGQASKKSRSLIKQEFNDPQSQLRILIATDVAAEGLNLQNQCRYVLHQEVPWNPMRLEQRNGRVDRYGQGRDVTVFHFKTDEDADISFLSYVANKVTQIREDLGSVGEVLDKAVFEHFSGNYIQIEKLDNLIEHIRNHNQEKEDLNERDQGTEEKYEETIRHFELTKIRMGFNEKSLARLLTQAFQIENGSIIEINSGVYRMETRPPTWEKMIDSSLQIQSKQLHGSMPKIVFDPKKFEVTEYGHPIFRPPHDSVLLRLGHPMMKRAVTTLKKQLWDESGKIKRWTVLQADLPSGFDIVACLTCTVTVRNNLGEIAHTQPIDIPFILTKKGIEKLDMELWREISHLDIKRLSDEQIPHWKRIIYDCWLISKDQLGEEITKLNEDTEEKFTKSFSETYKKQREDLANQYDDRIQSIELEKDSNMIERLRKDLEIAKEQYKQMTLTIEKEEELKRNLEKINMAYQDAMWEQQHSHNILLKKRLEAEKERILERVLPNRFTLSSVDVLPIAVKVIVRGGMYT